MSRILNHTLILLGLLTAFTASAKTVAQPKPQPEPLPANVLVQPPVKITVNGIKDETTLTNVMKLLQITTEAHLIKPITDSSLLNIYHNAPMNIRKAMQPYGYFNPLIRSAYTRRHHGWQMVFTVKPGIHAHVSKVNIEIIGQGRYTQQIINVASHYPLKKGSPFTLASFNNGNDELLKAAAQYGYFGAKLATAHMHVNLNTNTVAIEVVLDTDQRYRIGETTFSKSPFNRKFLEKYIAYKEGQYYDSKAIQQSQTNLSANNYFNQVVITPVLTAAHDHVIPIHVELKTQPRKVYTFGLGYNTDTQLRGLAAFKYRWTNAWGHYFDARAQASFVDYNIGASYNIPWPNPLKDLFTFRAAAGKLDIKRGTSQSYLLSALYQHHIDNWLQTASLNYLHERYNMYELPQTRANLIYPEYRISYYSTKNHLNPDNGLHLSADVSATPAALSSQSGFSRFVLAGKGITTFGAGEQLVSRLTYGRIYINNINSLPLSLQFLIGGSLSVRGYSFESIGPGRNMLYGSVELRQRVWKDLFVAGFYDFGNVTDNRIFGHIYDSVGPSILYRSPIGVIQISIPWRLAADHVRPRFVLSIGPEL